MICSESIQSLQTLNYFPTKRFLDLDLELVITIEWFEGFQGFHQISRLQT